MIISVNNTTGRNRRKPEPAPREVKLSKVKTALVGYGWWGRKMATLVRDGAEKIEIALIVDPSEDSRQAAGNEGFRTAPDMDAALTDPAIDAVIIATPHTFHTAQVRAAVNAGKHVFCEKPLALTAKEAEETVRLCAERNRVLGIGHERRFEPAMKRLIDDARSGAMGRIVQIEANFSHDKFASLPASNWRLDPANAPLAGMTATGIHLTDLAIAILGTPEGVSVYCDRLVTEIPQGDTFGAQVTFAGGGNAYIAASLGIPFISRFAVYGSKRWVEIRDKSHVEAPTGWIVLTCDAETGQTTTEEIPPAEAVLSNLEAFAAAALGEADYPIPVGDMVENTALLECMGRSARSGRTETVAERGAG